MIKIHILMRYKKYDIFKEDKLVKAILKKMAHSWARVLISIDIRWEERPLIGHWMGEKFTGLPGLIHSFWTNRNNPPEYQRGTGKLYTVWSGAGD